VQSPISYLGPQARRVLISRNPNAGARSGESLIDRLTECLESEGLVVDTYTDIDRVAAESAAAMADGRLRAVVAAGGDGTVALVANRTDPGVPLMVLPLGTENLLSKYLEIDADPESVCRTICDGATVRLDAGRAGERLFLLMLGCGFDAEVVRRLHSERTGHIHHLSYAKPILDSIRTYQYPELRVCCELAEGSRCDGETETEDAGKRQQVQRVRWVFVANLPRYAGGLSIVPDAIGTDGLLDVCTFKEGSLWNGLWYLGGIMTGQHQSWDDCRTVQARRVRIESDQPVPYQLDGDPGGFLPVDIEVVPQRLRLLVPECWATKHGFEIAKQSQH
jgi:diacylglycerol kinase (ATP)